MTEATGVSHLQWLDIEGRISGPILATRTGDGPVDLFAMDVRGGLSRSSAATGAWTLQGGPSSGRVAGILSRPDGVEALVQDDAGVLHHGATGGARHTMRWEAIDAPREITAIGIGLTDQGDTVVVGRHRDGNVYARPARQGEWMLLGTVDDVLTVDDERIKDDEIIKDEVHSERTSDVSNMMSL